MEYVEWTIMLKNDKYMIISKLMGGGKRVRDIGLF